MADCDMNIDIGDPAIEGFNPFSSIDIKKLAYPTVGDLFLKRTNLKTKMRDLYCNGCRRARNSCKLDQAVKHIFKCTEISLEVKEKLEQELMADKDRLNVLPGAKRLMAAQRLDRNLMMLVSVECLPLSFMRSTELRNVCSDLTGYRVNLAGPNRIRQSILPGIAAEFNKIGLEKIKNARDFSVTVEFDAWTSLAGTSILATVLTNLSGASMLLELTDISGESHTAEYLAKIAVEALKSNDIPPRKMNAIVSDEASNFALARKLVCERIRIECKTPRLIHYRCIAHVFNLILGSMVKSRRVTPTFQKLVQFINHVSKNRVLVTKLEELGGQRLQHSTPTRWYSLSKSISSVLSIKPLLAVLPNEPRYGISKWGETFNDDFFWDELKILQIYVLKISEMIAVCESSSCSIAQAFACFLNYGKFLISELPTAEPMRFEALSCYLKHFAKLDIRLLITAYVLDPNTRCKYVTTIGLDLAKAKIMAFLLDHGLVAEITGLFHAEFIKYLTLLDCEERETIPEVQSWWTSSNLLSLRIAARRLCACHGSSANTERVFSGLARIVTDRRTRLSLKTIFELMSIRMAKLSARDKLRCRSNRQDDQAQDQSGPSSAQESTRSASQFVMTSNSSQAQYDEGQEPPTGSQRASTGSQRASTGSQRASTGSQRASTGSQRVSTGGQTVAIDERSTSRATDDEDSTSDSSEFDLQCLMEALQDDQSTDDTEALLSQFKLYFDFRSIELRSKIIYYQREELSSKIRCEDQARALVMGHEEFSID